MTPKLISSEELQKHASAEHCWVAVNGIVWDLATFAPDHPGGEAVIRKYAGRDASEVYNSIHSPKLISNELDPTKKIGQFDSSSVPVEEEETEIETQEENPETTMAPVTPKRKGRRPLQTILSAHDFEEAASENLSAKAWAFFSSAATDCVTMEANASYFSRIWLRPRILKNVRDITAKTSLLGNEVGLPLFVSPTAMVKLAHFDGETVIAKGCEKKRIAQTISTNASFPLEDIVAAAPNNVFFFQLYINKDRAASERLLRQAEQAGAKAVFLTVDQPAPPKREADERVKAEGDALQRTPSGAAAANDARGSGLGRTMSSFIDNTLTWQETLPWLRSVTRLPIVLKGVQTAEDAILAAENGIDGLLIGNHGGRSLDTSSPALLVLLELRLRCPQELFDRLEIYLDGGIRRGTDIFKALCLGARAVGMGRSFLYAANYGAEGVEHLIEIMKDEFETTMRMMGCTDLTQLHPGLLNLGEVRQMIPSTLLTMNSTSKL